MLLCMLLCELVCFATCFLHFQLSIIFMPLHFPAIYRIGTVWLLQYFLDTEYSLYGFYNY